VKAVANLPLVGKGDVIGILYVDLTAPHQFFQDEKRLGKLVWRKEMGYNRSKSEI